MRMGSGQVSGRSHLWAVACTVDGDGGGEIRGGGFQGLAGVGSDQLTQLARVAEGDGAQPMLHTLRLHGTPHALHSHVGTRGSDCME